MQRRAIALIITLFFIMAITVSIGIGLKYINSTSNEVKEEKFLYQSSATLDDILMFLKESQELQDINSSIALFTFLSQYSFTYIEGDDVKVIVELKSARSKINISALDTNSTHEIDSLRRYFSTNILNYDAYVDMLVDNMGGIKEDFSYNSDIFYEKPYLFRDYIASYKHLQEINEYFELSYRDISLKSIDFEELFYYVKSEGSKIDLNYATPESWEIMLACDKQRAQDLTNGAGSYTKEEDLILSPEEKIELGKFTSSYFEPYLDVSVEMTHNSQSAKIRFEYDIKNKKGYGFIYEI